ncbi:MAG TPA: SIS domain-containing protein [Candidatus Eisenbacteria bacterium]|nr:SIS domain-containing protein [Candidatus Eisenbacteria bacterium]
MTAVNTPHVRLEAVAAEALERHLREVRRALDAISPADVSRVVEAILAAYRRDANVYVAGNGGSASTASHLACDLSRSTIRDGRRRLRIRSLCDSTALLTAWANDVSYECTFAEQLIGIVEPADVLLAISVSGNSPNVLAAVAAARDQGAQTVAHVGRGGGALGAGADVVVLVDSHDYGVVEDCHLAIQHAVIAAVRSALRA